LLDRIEPDRNRVSLGQLEQQLGLERSLDVQVQLCLRQSANKLFHRTFPSVIALINCSARKTATSTR